MWQRNANCKNQRHLASKTGGLEMHVCSHQVSEGLDVSAVDLLAVQHLHR